MADTPAIIVLAAGRGSRFAGPRSKLAQDMDGVSVLGRTIGHAIASQLPVIVVTTEPLVEEASRWVARRDVVVLPEVGSGAKRPLGMGHSIAAGVASAHDAGGWLVLPGDMPLVQPPTLRQVAVALDAHTVVYPQYAGVRGHPVGFAAELFSDLVDLTGDEGARRVLARYPSWAIEVDDPGVLIDVDTEADLAVVREHGRALPRALP